MSNVLACRNMPGFTELQTWIAKGHIENRYERHAITDVLHINNATILITDVCFYVFNNIDGECYFIAETLEMAKWYSVQVSRL